MLSRSLQAPRKEERKEGGREGRREGRKEERREEGRNQTSRQCGKVSLEEGLRDHFRLDGLDNIQKK